MSDSVQELLMLYKKGIIDVEALNYALKTFNNAPQVPQPQKKTLTDKEEENVAEKKENEKTKKGGNCCESKNVLNELNETFEAARESPFQLVDKTKCGYLRAHEMSVKRYKDPIKMFRDKKATIKNKITAELQELTSLKWSFGFTVDFFKDNKKIQGAFYSTQYAT